MPSLLGTATEPAQLLVLGTYRPVDAMLEAHPLRRMVQELCGRGQAVELPSRVPARRGCGGVCGWALGGPVAPALAAFVHERTDGNALFMVNIVEHLVQQGLVVRREGEWTLRRGPRSEVSESTRAVAAITAAAHRGPPARGAAGVGGRQRGG